MDLSIFFRTLWSGRLVGEDPQGNKYYEDKKPPRNGKHRRWVIYNGRPEASKVPAEWHGWLHHSTSTIPGVRERYFWEKDHLPNLTGTPYAHQPQGLQGIPPKAGYESWLPPEKEKG